MPQQPKHIGIIGYGRFGRLWASLLQPDFKIKIYDSALNKDSLEDVLNAEVIFYCLPISEFAKTIKQHAQILKTMSSDKLLVDMLSVKMHAKEVFQSEITSDIEIMLCHPMFGPDSVTQDGLAGQRIMLEKFRAKEQTYKFWKEYFAKLQLKVIEMTAEEHDKQAAFSQALTHMVGRILQNLHLTPSNIDTNNSVKLQEITEQVSKDEFQLFLDLQRYNPYTTSMRRNFLESQRQLYKQIEGS